MTKPLAVLPAVLLLALSHAAWAVPVRVQVLGPGKKPVPNAPLRVRFFSLSDLLQNAQPLSAVADAQGVATFEAPEEAPNGRGDLGQATAWGPGLSVGSAMLHAGSNEIALGPPGVARGLVVDGAGQPVPNALVRIVGLSREGDDVRLARPLTFSSATDAAVSQVRTDAQGRWSLGSAPLGGLLSVELGDDEFVRAAASSSALASDAPFDWAPLQPAARVAAQAPAMVFEMMGASLGNIQKFNQDGILVARAGASISGRVLGPTGAPVAGVSIMASPAESPYSFSNIAPADARGEFRIACLPAGDYMLSAIPLGAPKIEWVGGEAVKVKVAEGAGATAPELKMIQGGTIEVRLLDEARGSRAPMSTRRAPWAICPASCPRSPRTPEAAPCCVCRRASAR